MNTPAELKRPTTTVAVVAPLLGMSASSVYAAVKNGSFPFPTLKIGGRVIIPTAPIREALGFTNEPKEAA